MNYVRSSIKVFGFQGFQPKYRFMICPFRNDYSFTGLKRRSFKSVKLIKKDKIPDDYQIIYKAPIPSYLAASKNVTALTAISISLLCISEYYLNGFTADQILEPMIGPLVSEKEDLLYFSFAFILISFLTTAFIRRYPLRIYKNKTEYIAIFEGFLPFTKTKIYFRAGEVSKVPAGYIIPWNNSSLYKINKKKALLFTEHFVTPSELFDMTA